MTWEEFEGVFVERFLPQSVRKARAREFEELKQLPSMTMAEYDVHFTQLSLYTPYLVPTKHIRVDRFIYKLVRPLYRVVIPQVKTFPSYSITMDCVRMLKMKEIKAHVLKEKKKKHKAKGAFSGQSDGTSNKGSRT